MALMLATLVGFAGMEVFSWAFHKYIIHGPLWSIHKTHHGIRKGQLDLNDIFSLLFGAAAATAIFLGLKDDLPVLAGLGFGVTAYGFVYFILHDIAIHNRIKNRFLSRLPVLDHIRRAHKIHHKSLKKSPSRSFGLLFVRKSVFNPGE